MKHKDSAYTFYKISVLTFLMMISAMNYNILINPGNVVAGGVNGISIIVEEVFGVNPSVCIFIVSIAILLFALLLKEHKLVLSALYASIIYPIFVYLTSSLSRMVIISNDDLLLVALFSGIIAGAVSGIICKLEASQGGVILIAQVLGKKLKVSVASLNTVLSISIIILGAFVFGMNSVLYALVYLVSNKIVMEKLIVGVSQKKVFQIITSKTEEVEKFVEKDMKTKYTKFNVTSGKNDVKREVIMVSIPTIDYFRLKEGIKEIDNQAFVIITDAFESKGGK